MSTITDALPGSLEPSSAPVDTLPPELLASIFVQCFYEDGGDELDRGSDEDHVTMNLKGTPWTLCRVHRRWRDVALQTSILWSFINFKLSLGWSKPKFDKMLHTLKFMLVHSQNRLLHIRMQLEEKSSEILREPTKWRELLDLLFEQASRWRIVSFPGDELILEELERVEAQTLTNLESFQLNSHNSQTWDPRYDILSRCQNLQTLSLPHDIGRQITPPSTPWANLVNYHTVGEVGDQIRLLDCMPSLVRLEIQGPNSACYRNPRTITCKNVKQLYVLGGDPGLQALILPNLEQIFSFDWSTPASIRPMLVETRSCLREIVVIYSQTLETSSGWCSLLGATPYLESLALTDWHSEGLELMFRELARPGICTRLVGLSVTRVGAQSTIEVLSDTLSARRPRSSLARESEREFKERDFVAIQRVTLTFYKRPGDDFVAFAKQLQDDGVEMKAQLSPKDHRNLVDILS